MRRLGLVGLCLALIASSLLAWEAESVRMGSGYLGHLQPSPMDFSASCLLRYHYLLDDCAYVTVVEGIGDGETFGVHFSMADTVAWYSPCDTNACLTLDGVELVLYDVLSPPADQGMNLKIIGADASGEPVGNLLGNRDFEPTYVDTAAFTGVEIDFTNGGAEPGLDLSGCGGNFIALLTWRNASGHPCLVLDNVSTCVDSCSSNSACCAMGSEPYFYPRSQTHTYFYGLEWAWSKQDSFCDVGGCGTYGYLEAFWKCGFCTKSAATEPTSWGGIKAMYR